MISFFPRLLTTLATLLLLFAGAWFYSQVAHYWLGEPSAPTTTARTPQTQTQTRIARSGPLKHVELASQYFPEEHWVAAAKIKLRHENAYFFCNQWEPVSGQTAFRLSPFAMIQLADTPEKEPITILGESVLIEFEQAQELIEIDLNEVRYGALEGEVLIQGPDNLGVKGRNFVFSRPAGHLRSDNPIHFSYQGHSGSANQMQAELALSDRTMEFDIFGVNSLRLRRDVDMWLQTGIGKPPLRVSSDGSFSFSIINQTATFEQNVRARQQTPNGEEQGLTCERLELELAQTDQSSPTLLYPLQTNKAVSLKPVITDPHQKQASWTCRSLTATGPNVRVFLKDQQLEAHTEQLLFDVTRSLLRLEKKAGVQIWQKGNELLSPLIEVFLQQRQGAWKIEVAELDGQGEFHHRDPLTQEATLTARWEDGATFSPVEKNAPTKNSLAKNETTHSVSLALTPLMELNFRGTVLIDYHPQASQLQAEQLSLWLREPSTSANTRKTIPPSQLPQPRQQAVHSTPHFTIEQLFAHQNVKIRHPGWEILTQAFGIHFEQATQTTLLADSPLSPLETLFTKRSTSSPHADSLTSTSPTSSSNPTPSAFHQIQAEQFDIEALWKPSSTNKANLHIQNIKAYHQVHLKRSEIGQEPLEVFTQTATIRSPQIDPLIELTGTTSTVRFGATILSGPQFLLNQRENRLEVIGPGLLQTPVKNSLTGKHLNTSSLLKISWQEKLNFDGQIAHFLTGVRATLNEHQLRCQQMSASFSNPVHFSAKQPHQEQQQLEEILCQNEVEFESVQRVNQQPIEWSQARTEWLKVNQQTGAIQGNGPGQLIFWRQGSQFPGKQTARKTTTSSESHLHSSSMKNELWDFLQLDFYGPITGNFREKRVRLHQRVRAISAPVSALGETIDPYALPTTAARLDCQELELSQQIHSPTPLGAQATNELRANGNVKLYINQEGQNFQSRSDQATYDERNGLFTLRAYGEQNVTVWRQAGAGQPRTSADAKLVRFAPERNQIEVEQISGTQGIQPASGTQP